MESSVLLSCPARGTRLVGALAGMLAAILATGCSSPSPTQPTAPAKGVAPDISILAISATAEPLGPGGVAYRAVVKLRESAGAAATISAIDLTFMDGSSQLVSVHSDRPLSDTANVCPANATVDTRELMSIDDNLSHVRATSVVAKITFTDGAQTTNSTTGTTNVVALPAATYSLAGVLSDDSAGRAIGGGTVQILDGANAGKTTSTDGNGYYSMGGVAGGSFTVRATASGYSSSEQGVTVAKDTRLDLKLHQLPLVVPAPPPPAPPPSPPSSGPCAYAVASTIVYPPWDGMNFTVAIARTTGHCSWQATATVGWIAFTSDGSGSGDATLKVNVAQNASVYGTTERLGYVNITWPGGSAQTAVDQRGMDPGVCIPPVFPWCGTPSSAAPGTRLGSRR